MKKKTILSLEQALTLPYATQRFVHLGWRVIRLEATGWGDPNRYIGEDTGQKDLHSYFIPANIGKEAITLNLKDEKAQEILKKIIKELKVDVFMCNTLPKRYKQLGIDYQSLKQANPDLIWCGISAMGPDYPDRAGYDPALQALSGYMHLTGEPERDPMLCGLPIIDLKAGDEAYTQVLLAMLEQHENPGGKEINISMLQCAASWLITTLSQVDLVKDSSKLPERCGNEHRNFIPTNCYPTADGYVYLAIGSDSQWKKLSEVEGFEELRNESWKTNEGRRDNKEKIYSEIRNALKNYNTEKFIDICLQLNLAVAPVNSVLDVSRMEAIRRNMLKSFLPSGEQIGLYPPAVPTEFLTWKNNLLTKAPGLGQDNLHILKEIGLDEAEINKLKEQKII